MRSKALFYAFAAVAIASTHLGAAPAAEAGTYAGTKCVADKLKAASSSCASVLKAWSGFVGGGGSDAAKRDAAITKASDKLVATWSKSEGKATAKGADCIETTVTSSALETAIESAASAIATDVENGLNLSDKDDAKCGAALLKAASKQCAALVKAESGNIAKLSAGPGKRDDAVTKADAKFSSSVTSALVGCPTTATFTSLDTAIDALRDSLVTDTTIAPNVETTRFTTITPATSIEYGTDTLTPRCAFDTPYHFFVKKGTLNKLVMYYQGGGACWDYTTCAFIGTFDQTADPDKCTGGTNNNEVCDTLADCPDQGGGTACTAGADNPNHTTTGFGDLTNPNNPFKDWNIVFVSYCTGDIHFGDNDTGYISGNQVKATKHFGWHNARAAEKWAREHFVNPDEVFVTGSSAGAYGAFFNAPLNRDIWPQSKFSVLADAGNGVITPDFIEDHFPTWNFVAHLPKNIPGVLESIEDKTGIPAFTKAVAAFYPDVAWAHYSSSYDGGTGGQTGFYNVMKNPNNTAEWLNWWHSSCEWNDVMRQQAIQTAADIPSNYRYYIGAGSRHTMYGSNKVYTDTQGGVPLIADWVNSMRARDNGWTNVECSSDCGKLLPGDPKPTVNECHGGTNAGATCTQASQCPGGTCDYEAPFETQGSDVVITCP
jgi:Pectinacetylesterase